MHRRFGVFAALALLALALPLAAAAAISVTRAELSNGQLRVEGQGATPGATITVDGVAMGTAQSDGRFRVERSNYSSTTCTVTVGDGTTSAQATLSGCTPQQQPPPQPPPPAAAPTVQSVSVSPSPIVGGTTATGTVRLSAAPAAPAVVSLWTDEGFRVWTDPSVTVAAGATSATFPVYTRTTTATFQAHVTAAFNETLQSTLITVVPTAETDLIEILRADQQSAGGELRVEATSTKASAVLSAYDANSGSLLGTLSNKGGGRFEGRFRPGFFVVAVIVRSNFGGCAQRTTNFGIGDAPC